MMKKILRKGSQHSAGSGDCLADSENAYEIRKAVMTVDDRDACLRLIQDIARNYSAHIVCFDADKLAGREHAESAVIHAKRSVLSGNPISNSFEMEALLFAAGSRQCSVATVFGIHEGETNIYICSYPAKEELETYCKDVTPGEGRVLACLYARQDKLSNRCEYALYDAAAQLERAVAALTYLANECKDDLKNFCSGVKPGEGRLLTRIDKNKEKISGRCKEAIKDVGGK